MPVPRMSQTAVTKSGFLGCDPDKHKTYVPMLGLCLFQGLSYLCLGGKLHVNISRTSDVAALSRSYAIGRGAYAAKFILRPDTRRCYLRSWRQHLATWSRGPAPTVGNAFMKSREPSNIVAANSSSRKPVDPLIQKWIFAIVSTASTPNGLPFRMKPLWARLRQSPVCMPVTPKTRLFIPSCKVGPKVRSIPEHDQRQDIVGPPPEGAKVPMSKGQYSPSLSMTSHNDNSVDLFAVANFTALDREAAFA